MENREIKLRAWDNRWKCMVYDFTDHEYSITLDREGKLEIDSAGQQDWHKMDIMFSTGQKNKEGKESYDKDIIERNGHRYIIVFHEAAFMILPLKHWTEKGSTSIDWITAIHKGWFLAHYSEFKIIGNLYENENLIPELTEK